MAELKAENAELRESSQVMEIQLDRLQLELDQVIHAQADAEADVTYL